MAGTYLGDGKRNIILTGLFGMIRKSEQRVRLVKQAVTGIITGFCRVGRRWLQAVW